MRRQERRIRVERKIVEWMLAGHSDRIIARDLRVRRQRVQRLRILAEEAGYLNQTVPLPPYPEALFAEVPDGRTLRVSDAERILNEQRSWMEERLGVGWHPITIFEELPVSVSRSSFYRYMSKHRLGDVGARARRVIPEIVHEPGEALILDWGKLKTVTENGKRKILWGFAGVVGYSRQIVARVVWSNDTATTLSALSGFFEDLGGVTKRITSDNPKCFSLTADRYEPLLNPVYERFASHYGALIECLPPADPQKKGKVERIVPYLRRLFESFEPTPGAPVLEQAQEFMERKLRLANSRKHGTTNEQPQARFNSVEKQALMPLPALPYELEEHSIATVRQDSHVRFAGRYYSVEPKYIGNEVTILATRARVSIFLHSRLVETHDRVTDPLMSKSTKPEHLAPWERQLQDDAYHRTKARTFGEGTAEFVHRVLLRGRGFIDYRCICGIFSLEKSHSKGAIDTACAQAVAVDSLSYRTVRKLLAIGTPLVPSTPRISSPPRFTRPIGEYSAYLNLRVINGGKP